MKRAAPTASSTGKRYYTVVDARCAPPGVYVGASCYRTALLRSGNDYGRLGGSPGSIGAFATLEPSLNFFVQQTGVSPAPVYWD